MKRDRRRSSDMDNERRVKCSPGMTWKRWRGHRGEIECSVQVELTELRRESCDFTCLALTYGLSSLSPTCKFITWNTNTTTRIILSSLNSNDNYDEKTPTYPLWGLNYLQGLPDKCLSHNWRRSIVICIPIVRLFTFPSGWQCQK